MVDTTHIYNLPCVRQHPKLANLKVLHPDMEDGTYFPLSMTRIKQSIVGKGVVISSD